MNQITLTTPDGEETYAIASFGARALARIIDVLIIIIPTFLIPFIPAWLYFSLMQSGPEQATLGQRALDLKVVSLDYYDVSFGTATARFFGNFLNALTIGIGILIYFGNDKGQCLHDMIAGTVVVEKVPISVSQDQFFDSFEFKRSL